MYYKVIDLFELYNSYKLYLHLISYVKVMIL
ncbi:hypothetical protein Zm00014a_043103 [Zea mays]|uniref:Uncharacterized protein n=1 Tax=Zea mays TaxID=4577 RepID=A0A3L6FQD2_MAIZE|nr:hypothetical protein Zm00014a_043103 [Zea mays]